MNLNFSNDNDFLQLLTAIVEANLNNEQFGVSELAEKTGTSRSFLHRHLKSITNQSVSQFIREIRLEKAKQLLEAGKLTVSEIAYNVGFGSPSYFIKCFHEQFGYAPGEYVKYAENTLTNDNSAGNTADILPVNKTKKHYFVLLISALILVSAVAGIYFLFYHSKTDSSLPVDKSIAIIPFKNSGNNPEVQQLADGIVEDILNRLSRVSTLTVKSRNSSEIYRNSLKTTPEIAKELGVSYLAEGTILKEGQNIRLYIQLIDAVNDKHLWAEQYDKDLSGIFSFISDVSRQITGQLKATLSMKELEEIDKVYTENPEAYQLYLKGRFFLNRRTKEEIEKSVDYFNQALEIDPNYSLAWAGLGDSYFNLVRYNFIPETEGKVKSREYAIKSLEIDKSLAESHAVLGTIALILDMNWKEAERELNLALELNSNLDLAHLYYGHYLRNRGKFEDAIKHYCRAIDLDPNVLIPYDSRAYCLYQMGKFNESLVDWEKVKEINKFYRSAYKITFLIYVRQGEDIKAIEELKKIISIFYPEVKIENLLEKIHSEYGIEGVIRWYIKFRVENGQADGIDRLYAVIGDWDNALLNLEKMQWHFDYGLIKYGIEYKPIHNDPRFISLIKRKGLEDL